MPPSASPIIQAQPGHLPLSDSEEEETENLEEIHDEDDDEEEELEEKEIKKQDPWAIV